MFARFKLPLLALLTLLACLSIHEFGHILGAWMSGGRVTRISILTLRPHVMIAGAATDAQEGFRAAAGTGLSVLVFLLFAATRRRGGLAVRLMHAVALSFVGAELLGWMLSALFPGASGPDDARYFLAVSGFSRHSVAAVCAAAALLCASVFLRGGRTEAPRTTFR